MDPSPGAGETYGTVCESRESEKKTFSGTPVRPAIEDYRPCTNAQAP